MHSLMPHPHELPHLEPDVRFVLLTVLIGRPSEILEGILRGMGLVSVQEPLKEDPFVLDKCVTSLLGDSKHRGKLSSSLFKDSDQLISGTSCSYVQKVIQAIVHLASWGHSRCQDVRRSLSGAS
jgi:hypothetical protein